jgi:hypothetical protein
VAREVPATATVLDLTEHRLHGRGPHLHHRVAVSAASRVAIASTRCPVRASLGPPVLAGLLRRPCAATTSPSSVRRHPRHADRCRDPRADQGDGRRRRYWGGAVVGIGAVRRRCQHCRGGRVNGPNRLQRRLRRDLRLSEPLLRGDLLAADGRRRPPTLPQWRRHVRCAVAATRPWRPTTHRPTGRSRRGSRSPIDPVGRRRRPIRCCCGRDRPRRAWQPGAREAG